MRSPISLPIDLLTSWRLSRLNSPSFVVAFRITVIVAMVCTATTLRAQSGGTCTVELPANVMLRDGRVVAGVNSSRVVASVGQSSVIIQNVIPDNSPRRILLVVDNGNGMEKSARELTTAALTRVVTQARAGDQFALRTARGKKIDLPFGSDRATLVAAVAGIESGERGPSADGVLDETIAGLSWFKPAQIGDAILVIASNPDDANRQTGFSQVAKELEKRRIRLFTLLLGPLSAGSYWVNPLWFSAAVSGDSSKLGAAPIIGEDFNSENIGSLTLATGGYFAQDLPAYKPTDLQLDGAKTAAWHMYWAMASFYRVDMSFPQKLEGKPWLFDVTGAVKQRAPGVFVLYPRRLPACGN